MQKLNIDQETIFRRSSVFKESVNSKDIEKWRLETWLRRCTYISVVFMSLEWHVSIAIAGLVRADGHRDLQHARPAVDGPADHHHACVSVSG